MDFWTIASYTGCWASTRSPTHGFVGIQILSSPAYQETASWSKPLWRASPGLHRKAMSFAIVTMQKAFHIDYTIARCVFCLWPKAFDLCQHIRKLMMRVLYKDFWTSGFYHCPCKSCIAHSLVSHWLHGICWKWKMLPVKKEIGEKSTMSSSSQPMKPDEGFQEK